MLVSPDAIGDHFEWFEVLEKYTKGGTQKIDDTQCSQRYSMSVDQWGRNGYASVK
jgi:hypothetical protein